MSAPGFCAVCGRTFLVGERVRAYVSTEGRHEVCELCASRTEALGWLPADQDGAEERLRADAARRPSFLTKLFSRPEAEGGREGAESPEQEREGFARAKGRRNVPSIEGRDPNRATPHPDSEPASPRIAREPTASHDLDTESYDVESEWADAEHGERPNPLRRLAHLFSPTHRTPEPAEEAPPKGAPAANLPAPTPFSGSEREPVDPRTKLPAVRERGGPPAPVSANPTPERGPVSLRPEPSERPDPAGRGMRPRRLQPDLSPSTRFERAIVRFNAGEAGRTVAGLTRTLGAPSVSVGDLAGTDEVVRVTVAWELTWYQWGVDLGDELRPVYELAKGFEVAEIDSAARQWNASAHDGRVVMVAPSRRPAEDGRPVHR